jgi:nicotinate-nucleotide--dimethylbenzimidazole phosphoribosyltransferase
MTLEEAIESIRPLDPSWIDRAKRRLDRLTKPPGSLGRLEELAARYVAITEVERPTTPRSRVVVFAADHGVTAEGVSAYPRAVTAQMVRNFLHGGAAINVLARHVGSEVQVVDIGVAADLAPLAGLYAVKVAHGTKNFVQEPAMSRGEAIQALTTGVELARQAAHDGIGLIGTGEMGIGNTTSSAAVTAVMTGLPVEQVTGRGTGIDEGTYQRKVCVIEKALALHRPDPKDPVGVLAAVGGFELAGVAGLILGAAAHRIPVVLDGFITGAAALLAVALKKESRDYLIASHQSAEPGHRAVLASLGLRPLLDLDLRLGEGTGACLGISLVCGAIKILTQMATFEDAGVSDRLS